MTRKTNNLLLKKANAYQKSVFSFIKNNIRCYLELFLLVFLSNSSIYLFADSSVNKTSETLGSEISKVNKKAALPCLGSMYPKRVSTDFDGFKIPLDKVEELQTDETDIKTFIAFSKTNDFSPASIILGQDFLDFPLLQNKIIYENGMRKLYVNFPLVAGSIPAYLSRGEIFLSKALATHMINNSLFPNYASIISQNIDFPMTLGSKRYENIYTVVGVFDDDDGSDLSKTINGVFGHEYGFIPDTISTPDSGRLYFQTTSDSSYNTTLLSKIQSMFVIDKYDSYSYYHWIYTFDFFQYEDGLYTNAQELLNIKLTNLAWQLHIYYSNYTNIVIALGAFLIFIVSMSLYVYTFRKLYIKAKYDILSGNGFYFLNAIGITDIASISITLLLIYGINCLPVGNGFVQSLFSVWGFLACSVLFVILIALHIFFSLPRKTNNV